MTKLEFQDKYNLIEIAQNVLDNISCQEQEIEIPRSIYNRLNILGCSDYGNFSWNQHQKSQPEDCRLPSAQITVMVLQVAEEEQYAMKMKWRKF